MDKPYAIVKILLYALLIVITYFETCRNPELEMVCNLLATILGIEIIETVFHEGLYHGKELLPHNKEKVNKEG